MFGRTRGGPTEVGADRQIWPKPVLVGGWMTVRDVQRHVGQGWTAVGDRYHFIVGERSVIHIPAKVFRPEL